jgi:hypothetical protein
LGIKEKETRLTLHEHDDDNGEKLPPCKVDSSVILCSAQDLCFDTMCIASVSYSTPAYTLWMWKEQKSHCTQYVLFLEFDVLQIELYGNVSQSSPGILLDIVVTDVEV